MKTKTKPPEKDEIGPCEESKPIPKGAQCQEASVLSRESYIPCRAPAVAIVRHDKDRRSYYMCLPCADHNIRNRGGKLIRVNFAGRVLVQRARKLGRDCRDAPADEAKCLLVQIAATSGILAEDYNSEGSGADRAERWVTAGIRGRVLEMRDEGKGPGQ